MFDLTDGAAALIEVLTRNADLGPDSGLRLTVDPSWGSLAMGLVDTPRTADDVFIRHQARVFVASSAAGRLDARTLNARGERPAFFLTDS